MFNGSRRFSLSIGAGFILVFITFAFFSGRIADFFLGEEYYVIGNAASFPHIEAWWRYFLSNGRLVEGIYWTYLYELIDFHPAIIRLFSFGLLFLDALLAAIAISNVWPKKGNGARIAFVLLILCFFNPYALNYATRLSSDNARISIAIFWLAVIVLQKWVRSGYRPIYLVGALTLQTIGLFTYENIMFLFPAAVLLCLPLITAHDLTANNKRILKRMARLFAASMFLFLIPFAVYFTLANTPGVYFSHYAADVGSPAMERFVTFVATLWQNVLHLGDIDMVNTGLIGTLLYALVITAVGILIIVHYRTNRNMSVNNWQGWLGYTSLFLASVWILVFSLAPYSFAGIQSYRVYVTATMGIPVLLLLLYYLIPKPWRMVAAGLAVVWIVIANIEFELKTKQISTSEATYNNYLLQVYELVPDVRPRTWFVFIDFSLGSSGCGPSPSILYEKPDLLCGRLSTRDPFYMAERHAGDLLNIVNTGGWIRDGNILLFGLDENGRVVLIPQITISDPVYITWLSIEPIKTDFRRIVTDSSRELSPMAMHLYYRAGSSMFHP